MRVIAGKARGHKLKAPAGMDVRPTLDRVKESVFNMIHQRLMEAVVVDLFAGTGNLGIEALSRGAQKAYFIDQSKKSIQAIQYNLEKTRFTGFSQVINLEAVSGIKRLAAEKVKADLIFMDPPYGKDLVKITLEAIHSHQLLKAQGMIIIEHDIKDEMEDTVGPLTCVRRKAYGQVVVSFYQLKEEIS